MLVTAFHPELTEDLRFHRYFLALVEASRRELTPKQ
jgi:glutamine amidotransferase PdxT